MYFDITAKMISGIKRIYAELRAKTFSIYYQTRMPHIPRLLNLQKGMLYLILVAVIVQTGHQ